MKGNRLLLMCLLMFQCVSAVRAENIKLEPKWSYFGGGVGVGASIVEGLSEDKSTSHFFAGQPRPG